jgi:hypothetical protein
MFIAFLKLTIYRNKGLCASGGALQGASALLVAALAQLSEPG